MSFLNSTRNIVTRTALHPQTDRARALELLQDFNIFPNLQPLVIENKAINNPPPTEWQWLATEAVAATAAAAPAGVIPEPEYRVVTACVPFGPFFSSAVTTKSAYVKTEDGMITIFQAPLGLYGQNRWSIIPAGYDNGLVLQEEATLTGPFLLMPFIVMTEQKSHAELGGRFSQILLDELRGESAQPTAT